MERILYFGIAFSVIFLIIGYVADKILNITTHLSNTEKKKWEANVLGIVFSCIAGPVGVYCNYYPQNGEVISSIYGKSDDIVLLLDFACGYFLYDIIVSMIYFDRATLIHGIACFLVYGLSNYPQPFIHQTAAFFLIFEFSTPFLNMRNILLQLKRTDSIIFPICTYMFAISFFTVRIVVGIPRSYIFWQDILDLLFYHEKNDLDPNHPVGIVYYMLVANTILNGLNIYWMFLIIQSVTKNRDKKKKKN